MIPLKSEKDLEYLRAAGKILSAVIKEVQKIIKPGIATIEIDRFAEELITKKGALPAFKGYKGFPATACVSVNEEIVHGIPSERKLAEGDIVSIDLGVNYHGYFSDAAVSLPVGRIDAERNRLIKAAKGSLEAGIKKAMPGKHLSDISSSIQHYVERCGFSVVRQFVGHGIGLNLHEEPEIPNFGRAGEGPVLKEGMVLAIEPMINLGSWEAEISENGWTAVTRDKLPSAHFEHTVAVTGSGSEILTV
ncbi:MAG: type I methionyl aminopeptidase [Candidatus Omnitrophota bacterium]|jgi:methionyl aminopeptidase